MFCKNPERTGFSTETGVLDSAGIRWQFIAGGGITFSSPAIGDINNDSILEIVIGADDYKLYMLQDTTIDMAGPVDSGAVRLRWTYPTNSFVQSSPLLIDITGDGVLEVIFASFDDSVYAVDGLGNLIWKSGTGGWIFSSSVGGDLEGDGMVEIAVGSYDGWLYVLRGMDGNLKWKCHTGGAIRSSPALGDINGDDTLEVVVGSDDGKLYAFHNGDTLWQFPTGSWIYSTPAIGDLDKDGDLDVVVGSYDGYVYALDGPSGTELWAPFWTGGWIDASPSIADIDGDDTLEIIIGSGGGERLYCIEGESGVQKWEVNPSFPESWMIRSSCAIGDIDNDGGLEIVLGTHDFYCTALNADGIVQWKRYLGGDPHSSPALADIDGDGNIEVVIATLEGKVFALDWPVWPVGVEENPKSEIRNPKLEAYPNPFTTKTTIDIRLKTKDQQTRKSSVSGRWSSVCIYDLSGRLVKTFPLNTDHLSLTTAVVWDGCDNLGKQVSPGIYFCGMDGGAQVLIKKLVYIK